MLVRLLFIMIMFCVSASALEINLSENEKSNIAKQMHDNFVKEYSKKPTYCNDYTSQEMLYVLKAYISNLSLKDYTQDELEKIFKCLDYDYGVVFFADENVINYKIDIEENATVKDLYNAIDKNIVNFSLAMRSITDDISFNGFNDTFITDYSKVNFLRACRVYKNLNANGKEIINSLKYNGEFITDSFVSDNICSIK